MKNIMIFLTLVALVVLNFSGCGRAQERPPKPNKKIQNQVIAIDSLTDITKTENQNTEENINFKKKLITKLDSAEKRNYAEGLLAENKLVFMLMNEKVLLLEFVPSEQNKNVSTAVKLESQLYSFDELMNLKNDQAKDWSKVSLPTQNRFAILAEIAIQTGILENETTDYNEKKSTLKLTETNLEKSQFLILKSEIKAVASGDAQK